MTNLLEYLNVTSVIVSRFSESSEQTSLFQNNCEKTSNFRNFKMCGRPERVTMLLSHNCAKHFKSKQILLPSKLASSDEKLQNVVKLHHHCHEMNVAAAVWLASARSAFSVAHSPTAASRIVLSRHRSAGLLTRKLCHTCRPTCISRPKHAMPPTHYCSTSEYTGVVQNKTK